MMLLSLAVAGRAGGAEVGTAMPLGAEVEQPRRTCCRLMLSTCSLRVLTCGVRQKPNRVWPRLSVQPYDAFA